MTRCILALDQGTTSSRAILFSHDGRVVASAQEELEQILPAPGLVEHDPDMRNLRETRRFSALLREYGR